MATIMKKSIEVSEKARANNGWCKHMERDDQRRAWKSNRRLAKKGIQEIVDEIHDEEIDRIFSLMR